MSSHDDLIGAFTAKQFGVVALWQTRSVGIPDHVVFDRRDRGALELVFSGVYRLRGVPYTKELRWMAAVLAGGPDAWLSHRAAAAFIGFEVRRVRPEITIPHGRECQLGGIDVHRTRRRSDVIVVRGMPVTTGPRTILDCATVLPVPALHDLVQTAVTSGLVKIEALLAIVDRRGGRGVSGTVATREVLTDGLVDDKLQQRLELLLARIIDSANVPPTVRQHRLTCADGREVVLDNAWVDRRIALEAVGLRWHGSAHHAAKTRARSRSITNTGWDHYEYGWSDAVETPDHTRTEIESIWAGSRGRGPRHPAQNGGEGETDAAA